MVFPLFVTVLVTVLPPETRLLIKSELFCTSALAEVVVVTGHVTDPIPVEDQGTVGHPAGKVGVLGTCCLCVGICCCCSGILVFLTAALIAVVTLAALILSIRACHVRATIRERLIQLHNIHKNFSSTDGSSYLSDTRIIHIISVEKSL